MQRETNALKRIYQNGDSQDVCIMPSGAEPAGGSSPCGAELDSTEGMSGDKTRLSRRLSTAKSSVGQRADKTAARRLSQVSAVVRSHMC